MNYAYADMENQLKPYEAQGRRLRQAREEAGIEQADMARRIGVEPGTYWRYEVGERSPHRSKMDRIAAILQKTTAYFYHGESTARPLTRGEAFARIEDSDELDELRKARLRALLGKFRNHQLDEDYFEAICDLVKHPGVSDETMHGTAVQLATDAAANRTAATKITPITERPSKKKRG